MTLVELMISMIIFSVAVGIAFTAVIIVVQKSADAQNSAAAVGELRLALAQIDKQVRSGNVLLSPEDEPAYVATCRAAAGTQSGTCMRIFTQSNGADKCVQWQVILDSTATDGTYVLRTRSWVPLAVTAGSWDVVARGLYLPPAVAPSTVTPDPPFTLLGASTAYDERSLQIELQAWDARRDKPVHVESILTGRNTSYGYDSGQCIPPP